MSDDLTIPFLSNELEDAGWLGLAAAGLLAPFVIGAPGALSSTSTGFVWTKTLGSSWSGESFPFGIGRLKINSGLITTTVGVNWYNGAPEVGLLFTFLDGASVTLEIDEEYAYLATKRTLPDHSVIGYEADRSTLAIPLPAAALEFTFRKAVDGGVASAVRTHGAVATVDEIAHGVFRWSPDPTKVIVLPKLFDIALNVADLFLDLSDGAAVGAFLQQFPEVYTPQWKGFGATQLGLIIPTDQDEFITVTADGFVYEFDGGLSGKCTVEGWSGAKGTVRGLSMGLDIRKNDIVRGEIGLTVDLNGGTQRLVNHVTTVGPTGNTADQQAAIDENQSNLAEPAADAAVQDVLMDGLVQFKGTLISTHAPRAPMQIPGCPAAANPPNTDVFGFDLRMENILLVPPGGNTPQPITTLNGSAARVGSWLLGGAIFGPALLTAGIVNDSGADLGIGIGLLVLAVGDIVEFLWTEQYANILPNLERLDFDKMGMRYLHVTRFDETTCSSVREQFFEIFTDFTLRYNFSCGLVDVIGGYATIFSTLGALNANLFGFDLNQVRLEGPLELAFSNAHIRFKFDANGVHLMPTIDTDARRLLQLEATQIIAKDMPALVLDPTVATDGTGKPVVSAEFVSNTVGEITKYGIAVSLKGIGGASLAVNGAAAGLVFYFSPHFDVEIMPQLSKDPGFQFVVPPVCLATGVIELGKPLPGFGGEQNRIAVDVGLINSEVRAGAKLDKAALAKLHELKNYQYQFGGEVVWGNASGGPANAAYDFLFVEAHYEGKSPLFTVGPVGLFGLGGLFGRNIEPGITGNRTAMGLANWIQGTGDAAFDNVKNWPAGVPSDTTWHPARDWNKDRDLWAVGLFIKAGSASDGGKNVMVDGLLLLTLPEFRLALAGKTIIKPINGQLAVVIAYDHPSGSFIIKGAYTYKVDENNGNIVKIKTQFELGSTKTPAARSWFYLGHYLDNQGGPAGAELFSLFNTKGYYVIDSKKLEEFGIVPSITIKRPEIPGPAVGMGMLFQLGPKKYGPSWLNVQVYGGFGYNVAFGINPMLVYGDIYALGYLKLKVAFFKAKLELAARLYGLATFDSFRFAGEFLVRLNLPWPLDDVEESIDFFLEAGTPVLQKPHLQVTAAGLNRLESRSQELSDEPLVELPIDALIALHFNKPILAINDTPPASSTQLTVNEVLAVDGNGDANPPTLNQLREVTTSKFVETERETTYEVIYTYTIDHVTVRYGDPRPDPNQLPTNWTKTTQMAAVWQVPSLYNENGMPEEEPELHHALYRNGFLPTELQFSSDFLQRFEETYCSRYLPPCGVPTWSCLLPGIDDINKQPPIDQSLPLYTTTFVKPHGPVTIRELVHYAINLGPVPRNLNRLSWQVMELALPHASRVALTDADTVHLDLHFQTADYGEALETYIEAYTIDLTVQLRGQVEPMRLQVALLPDTSQPCLFVLNLATPAHDAALLSAAVDALVCTTPGEIIFRVELIAHQFNHLLQSITVEGPVVKLTPLALSELNDPDLQGQLEELWGELGRIDLRLHQLCYRYARNERGYWSNSEIAGGPGAGDPDTLWDNQLLEPGKIYEIRYGLHADGSSRIVERTEENCPEETDSWSYAGGDHSQMPIIRFRTEAEPSQDVSRYVGFSYPAKTAAHPFYPAHFAPFLTLKDRGLIRRIYQKHYGHNALQAKLVDMTGSAVEAQVTNVELSSSAPDCVLEELAENCLPEAEGWTNVQVNYWETPLATNSAYALQLEDSGRVPARPAYRAAFRTSRFASFDAHLDHLHTAIAEAQQIPVLDGDNVGTTLSTIIHELIAGEQFGMDGVVERFYRQLLGINAGRLADRFGRPGEEFVAYLTAGTNPDYFTVWGIVLELSEPLIGREGVIVEESVAAMNHLAPLGILVTESDHFLVHDRAGARLLIFNSGDGVNFERIRSDVELNLRYAPAASLEPALTTYVQRTWPHLTPAAQANKVAETYATVAATLQANPLLADRLDEVVAKLTIPRGVYLP
ncbi:MAG: hypothetical protein KDE58_04625 [Caldilineaceae bacterium]|nr:hypothetical protein [Caldilineaceae bacterium]